MSRLHRANREHHTPPDLTIARDAKPLTAVGCMLMMAMMGGQRHGPGKD